MSSGGNGSAEVSASPLDGEKNRRVVSVSLRTSGPAAAAATSASQSEASPPHVFHFYPQSLWFDQCQGRIDADLLTPENTYTLLPHERLAVGRCVLDPGLADYSNPEYRPRGTTPRRSSSNTTPSLRTRSGRPHGEALGGSPVALRRLKRCAAEEVGFLPVLLPTTGGPANDVASVEAPQPAATYPVVVPLYPFSAASLFFPIHYARPSAREASDARGIPKEINKEFHPNDRADLLLSSISIQRNNLNRMPLYKIGPGAVAFSVVINSFEVTGMKYTKSNELFNVIWAKRATSYTLESLTAYQKVNHFPGTWGLGRKDNLAMNINMMKRYYGEDVFDIIPPSFSIPKEQARVEKDAARHRAASESPPIYIVKPCASSCGRGITLHKGVPPMPAYPKESVCQRYIGDPLLIGDRKFDLRLYCVVTSFDPLRIYLFDEGLVRFAAMKYPGPDKDLDNINMHLTNYSINKTAELKRQTGDKGLESEDPIEIKWCISDLKKYFINNYPNGNMAWDVIQRGCDDAVVKAFLSVESSVVERIRQICSDKTGRNCFELFGIDLLVDRSLKVWLIEMNIMPSLATGSNLDKAVKSRMLAHMLTLIRVIPNQRNALDSKPNGGGSEHNPDKDFVPFGAAPTIPERIYKFGNHPAAVPYAKCVPLLKRFNDLNVQESMLSRAEVLMLVEAEEEMHCAGGFRCIFPAKDTLDSYLPLFTHGVRRNNFLLASAVKQKRRNSGSVLNLYI